MGIYERVGALPADPILGIAAEYDEDPRAEKVFLAVGVYREENGSCKRMEAVYEAEKKIIDTEPSKVYLPIEGNKKFLDEMLLLVLGEKLVAKHYPQIAKIQSLGGTGAIHLATKLLIEEVSSDFHLPNPTWPNHKLIEEQAGGRLHHYPYYDPKSKKFLFDEWLAYLKNLPAKSVILIHACCHNPTGIDPSKEQWQQIAHVMKEKGLIALFDMAYLGIGEGIQEDAYSVRLFVEEGVELLIALSLSKTFGLYAERVGALFVMTQNKDQSEKVVQHLRRFARATYSNPPKHGVSIVEHIMHDDELKKLWENELDRYRKRLKEIRHSFYDHLKKAKARRNYDYILERNGMFCYTGLSQDEVLQMRERFAIYLTLDGRMNLSGLNRTNINYVALAIAQVGG